MTAVGIVWNWRWQCGTCLSSSQSGRRHVQQRERRPRAAAAVRLPRLAGVLLSHHVTVPLQILQEHQQQPRADLQNVRCAHFYHSAMGVPFLRRNATSVSLCLVQLKFISLIKNAAFLEPWCHIESRCSAQCFPPLNDLHIQSKTKWRSSVFSFSPPRGQSPAPRASATRVIAA